MANFTEPPDIPQRRLMSRIWRSPQRWIIGLVLMTVAGAYLYYGQFVREGKWLVGQWEHFHTYDDGTTVQRNWSVDSNGRVRISNDYAFAGKNPHKEKQLSEGQWTESNGRLQIKWGRPIQKDVILAATRTQRFFHNLVIGQRGQIVDGESSDGRLVEKSTNEFDVIWQDPFANADSEAQSWTRVR